MTPKMKNTKFLLVLALSAVLTSCSQVEVPETGPVINKEWLEVNMPPVNIETALEKPYSNPVLIYGSSFGEYFQVLYKTGKFEDMLAFTSSASIEKFGQDKVLNFYKTMDFAYDIKLKSINAAETPVGVTTLNYIAGIMATRSMLRMGVVVENDSCKIVLEDLKSLR